VVIAFLLITLEAQREAGSSLLGALAKQFLELKG